MAEDYETLMRRQYRQSQSVVHVHKDDPEPANRHMRRRLKAKGRKNGD